MTILVTGAAGFIGSHVARRLVARGEAVIGIDNLNDYSPLELKQDRLAVVAAQEGGSFDFHRVDFSDMAALDLSLKGLEIDRIVHLGAQAGVRYSITHPHAYASSNLAGHLNMLEVARQRSVRHLVYASSSSVYGRSGLVPYTDDDEA